MLRHLALWATVHWTASIALGQSINHDRFQTLPRDHFHTSIAYVSSFDTNDDDDGDGDPDSLGTPHWVSYQLDAGQPIGPNPRPDRWQAVPGLPSGSVSPTDDSYRNSGFSRGHMCRRLHAHFSGPQANFESFNIANACPQMAEFNAGHWLGLEDMTTIWANEFGTVWVTCGPLFDGGNVRFTDDGFDLDRVRRVGDPGEVMITVPRSFFKTVVRESSNPDQPHVLAFIYPHDPDLDSSSLTQDHSRFLVSVDEIEARSGLDLFSVLPDAEEAELEASRAPDLWPLHVSPSLLAASAVVAQAKAPSGSFAVMRRPSAAPSNGARVARPQRFTGPWGLVETESGVFLLNSQSGQSFVYDGQSQWNPIATPAGDSSRSLPPQFVPAVLARPDFGTFEGRVVAIWDGDGRDMTIQEAFHYVDRNGIRWTAPAESTVNGASIPSVFWSTIGGPFSGMYRNASVVHDVYCQTRTRAWRSVHRMFYEACRCGGVGRLKAKLMYYAVYHFGPRWDRFGLMLRPRDVAKLSATSYATDVVDLEAVEAYIRWKDPTLEELESLTPAVQEDE